MEHVKTQLDAAKEREEMTDKKQPEALRLADEAWNFDCSEYRGVRSANAAMMGKLQDCADMIRKLHTENTALQQGYAAARLEIESLQARIKTMAEEHADELMVAHLDGRMRASHGQAPSQAIPAAAAGCTRSHPHENMDSACRAKAAIAEMQNMAARGAEATTHDLERFVAMLAVAPTTQPAPVRGTPADLPPLPDPDLRDVGTNPEDIKNFLRGYATEYAKVALAAHKQGANHD